MITDPAKLSTRLPSFVPENIGHWIEMLPGKVVTVLAGFGAETISQDFWGITERDTSNSGL